MSAKHTPAPWTVEKGGFVGGPVGFGHVCQLWNKFEEDFQRAEANAQLIAAAPELLHACKTVDAYLEMLGDGEGTTARLMLRKAITKAAVAQ